MSTRQIPWELKDNFQINMQKWSNISGLDSKVHSHQLISKKVLQSSNPCFQDIISMIQENWSLIFLMGFMKIWTELSTSHTLRLKIMTDVLITLLLNRVGKHTWKETNLSLLIWCMVSINLWFNVLIKNVSIFRSLLIPSQSVLFLLLTTARNVLS